MRFIATLTILLLWFFFGGYYSHAQQQGASNPPILVQAANVTSDASGNWSVTWATNFQNNNPIVSARAVLASPGNPISCEVAARSASSVSGWCRQSSPALLNLSIITAGLTLNPFANLPATGTAVMVIGRDTTQ